MSTRTSSVLWLHMIITGTAGLLFFLFPRESATVWPWPFPPLAARFMASLFLGGAACSLACLLRRDSGGLFVMVLVALGDGLIALSGALEVGRIGFTPKMFLFLAFFAGLALVLALALLSSDQRPAPSDGMPVPRLVRAFFAIHLMVVLPVGVAMYVFPAWAQHLWPWQMPPLNIRLIGSFFFGAAFISAWALGQRAWNSLRPTLILYACFASLATIASLIHIGLFDPTRFVTWAFFGLYVFVACGSALFWWRLEQGRPYPFTDPVTPAT